MFPHLSQAYARAAVQKMARAHCAHFAQWLVMPNAVFATGCGFAASP
jgi:hypothetical protein